VTLLLLKDQPGLPPLDNSAGAATVAALVRQEIPGHPLPQAWSGDQTYINVAPPPQIGQRLVGQEQPWHPLPLLVRGQPQISEPERRGATLAQEYPSGHPLPQGQPAAGVQGPNVAAPPQVQAAPLVRQELPGHPLPATAPGIAGPNVAPPPPRIALVGQEQPGHPGPQAWSDQRHATIASPPQIEQRLVVQEQPPPAFAGTGSAPMPAAALGAGVSSNTAPPPQIQSATVAQEQPAPSPAARFSQTAQNAPPQVVPLVVAQERSGDAPSFARPGLPGPNVAPFVQRAIASQEQPPVLPTTQVWPSRQGPNVLAPVSQIVVAGQEQPAVLPRAQLWPGQPAWLITADVFCPVEWLSTARIDPALPAEMLAMARADPHTVLEDGLAVAADPPVAIEILATRRLDNVPLEWGGLFRADAPAPAESGSTARADVPSQSEDGMTARGDAVSPSEITTTATTMTADSSLPLGWLFNPFVFGRRRLRLLGRTDRGAANAPR
jgi:hypothetical protein